MEKLILVTVLITLFSVAVVGSIAYLVAVVRKLRQVVKDNVVDITNLQQSLDNDIKNLQQSVDNYVWELRGGINDLSSELHKKIDSRCDKLYDGYNKLYDEYNKELERLSEMTRQSLGLKK
jgi:gas vesicle protein